MKDLIRDEPTRGYWIISIVALFWNLLGVMAYLMQVTLTDADFAAMSAAERALYADLPTWVTAAYAIAVFSGVLACAALLLRKGFAVPLFAISLLAVLAQMAYSLLLSNTVEVLGSSALIMPVAVIVIGAYLLMFASNANKRGILS
jgi:hypothetical protein